MTKDLGLFFSAPSVFTKLPDPLFELIIKSIKKNPFIKFQKNNVTHEIFELNEEI